MTIRILAAAVAISLLTVPAALATDRTGQFVLAQADTEASQYLAETRALDTLSDKELKQRIRAGRKLIKGGSLAQEDVKKVRQAMRAARKELRARNKDDAEDNQDDDTAADQPADGASVGTGNQTDQTQKAEIEGQGSTQTASANTDLAAFLADARAVDSMSKKELRQKIRAGRKLMRDKSTSKADRQKVQRIVQAARKAMGGQGGDPAEDAGSDQAQTADEGNDQSQATGEQAGVTSTASGTAAEYLADNRPLDQLSAKELRQRMQSGRNLIRGGSLSQADRKKVQQAVRAARAEVAKRGGKGGQANEETDQADAGDGVSADTGASGATVETTDSSGDVKNVDDAALRNRMKDARDQLASGNLSPAESKVLRQKLAKDRRELRQRVARKSGREEKVENQAAIDWQQDRREAKALKTRELEGRIAFYRARLGKGDLSPEQKAQFELILDRDRLEFRSRAIAVRDERIQKLKRRVASNEINIRINIVPSGPPLPPAIWAAEADDDVIVTQLIRQPGRKFDRRYSFEEIAAEPELREALPAVEVDTVTFGFNEDFVREEQLENLDRIGQILEEILAAHPNEVFMIEGHTDAVGTDEYNNDLSGRRAAAIEQALTEYYSIAPGNLETVGYGERYLKIETEEPEEENRRITIRRVTSAVGALEG